MAKSWDRTREAVRPPSLETSSTQPNEAPEQPELASCCAANEPDSLRRSLPSYIRLWFSETDCFSQHFHHAPTAHHKCSVKGATQTVRLTIAEGTLQKGEQVNRREQRGTWIGLEENLV